MRKKTLLLKWPKITTDIPSTFIRIRITHDHANFSSTMHQKSKSSVSSSKLILQKLKIYYYIINGKDNYYMLESLSNASKLIRKRIKLDKKQKT